MEREDESRQHRSGNGQAPQNRNQQKRRKRMPQHIDKMIADDGVAPDLVLDPKRRVQKRIILLRRTDLGPNPPEPGPRLQGGARDVPGIIPQKSPPSAGR